MKDIEIIPEPGEKLKKDEPVSNQIEMFMTNWRNCEYYNFVMNIIEEELGRDHLQTLMRDKYLKGESMTNEEIGRQAQIDLQVSMRIENIRDALK